MIKKAMELEKRIENLEKNQERLEDVVKSIINVCLLGFDHSIKNKEVNKLKTFLNEVKK